MRWGKLWKWSPASGKPQTALTRIQKGGVSLSDGRPGETSFIGGTAASRELGPEVCIG